MSKTFEQVNLLFSDQCVDLAGFNFDEP